MRQGCKLGIRKNIYQKKAGKSTSMNILVAHPAQQHSYRLAYALEKTGMLYKYVTTVYYKKVSFTALVSKCLLKRYRVKAESRRCEELPDSKILQFCEIEGLIKLLALNTRFFKRHYRTIKYHTADRFARKVARYVFCNRECIHAVITYEDTSPELFEKLAITAPDAIRIMDVSSANCFFMRAIYERDMQLSPEFAKRLREERKICWDSFTTERIKREYQAAQYFLVPSEFVGQSLEYSGIRKDQIFYCPYGVDTNTFCIKEYERLLPGTRPLEFIYVGGVKELKGISYLLKAFEKIPQEQAYLTVVGQYNPTDKDTSPYTKNVNFTGSVFHSEVPALLQKADVFIFPSLGEGMSLSAIEAASCGLPLILSENSGLKELINDGENGFIVPIQSTDALVDKIEYFINNPEQIQVMGKEARKIAEKYTWESYSSNVVKIVKEIVTRHMDKEKEINI